VVGATGNIGRVLAEVATASVDELVLVGRPQALERLRRCAAELEGRAARVRVATDRAALRDCNLIVSATNAAKPLIHARHVGSGRVVIVDVAVPRDVDPALSADRPEAIILRGGLVQAPAGQQVELEGASLA